ncbi:MAG: hypothetical protein Q4F55_00025, partial [Bacillota bacterium]|nr:hypothetical protein [Bacillota bacterium]
HCERSEAIHFFGDGCELIGQKSLGVQEAEQVLAFAEKMYQEGKIETCYTVAPEYLRLAEAERKLLEGKG